MRYARNKSFFKFYQVYRCLQVFIRSTAFIFDSYELCEKNFDLVDGLFLSGILSMLRELTFPLPFPYCSTVHCIRSLPHLSVEL